MQSRAAVSTSLQLPCRARIIRFMEGVSLWLAFLLMLSTHSLMAGASEAEVTGGQFHFVDQQGAWQEPATLLNADYREQLFAAQTAVRSV